MSTLCAEARETARRLLTHYVKVQGLVISQMLRKSVETRDWLSTLEPRNVRAVMKRVVEDTTAIDVQVLLSADCWSPHACRALDSSSLRAKQRGSDCIYIVPPEPPFHTYGTVEAQSHPESWSRDGLKLGFRLIFALPLFHSPDCVSGDHTYDSSTSK